MKKPTNRNNKELGYVNYHRTKSVTTRITTLWRLSPVVTESRT